MKILDGKKLSEEIFKKVKSEVARLPFVPVFCDVLVGEDPASKQYVQMKAKAAEQLGMKFYSANFKETISTEDLIKEIKALKLVPNMCGIIVQLPLPGKFTEDKRMILDAVPERFDVDCLGTIAGENFYSGETALERGFPTALACLALLDSLNLDLKNKKIVVLGQGDLVGKPVTALLKFRGLNPDIIQSKAENKEEIIKQADIIISGMGQGKYITGAMIKKGAVLIDAGTSEEISGPPSGLGRASIVGDVDLESVKDVAGYVSPVPGGVGPMTVAMLLQNVLKVAKQL